MVLVMLKTRLEKKHKDQVVLRAKRQDRMIISWPIVPCYLQSSLMVSSYL